MTHFVRIFNLEHSEENTDKDDQGDEKTIEKHRQKSDLAKNHKKYSYWKWYVLVLSILVHIVFTYSLFQQYKYYSNERTDITYLLICAACTSLFFIGYLSCLILLITSVKMLRRWLHDLLEEGIDTNAACKHITVVVLVLFSSMFGQIITVLLISRLINKEKSVNDVFVVCSEFIRQLGQSIALIILI